MASDVVHCSHVHLCREPLHFDPKDATVFVDEASRLLFLVRHNVFFVHPYDASVRPMPPVNFVNKGPVLGVKVSLDRKYLAIQRNTTDIEVVDMETTTDFPVTCRQTRHPPTTLLGFHWVLTEICDLVLVTTAGLELHKLHSAPKSSSKLVKSVSCPAAWYCFVVDCQLILMATGPQSNTFRGFQIQHTGVSKIPKFDVDVKSGRLEERDVVVIRLYSRLFCVHINSHNRELVLFQLGREAVVKKYTINLFSPGTFALSVVDNLIIVHNTDTKIAMVFDIHCTTQYPVAAPLPLGPCVGNIEDDHDHDHDRGKDDSIVELYPPSWRFLSPAFVLDEPQGLMWTISVNLEEIVLSSSEKVGLIDMLMKRSRTGEAGGKALVLRVLKEIIKDGESLTAISRLFDKLNVSLIPMGDLLGSGGRPRWLDTGSATNSPRLAAVPRNKGRLSAVEGDVRALTDRTGMVSAPGSTTTSPAHWDHRRPLSLDMRGDRSAPRPSPAPAAYDSFNNNVIVEQTEIYAFVLLPLEETRAVNFRFLRAVVIEYIRSLHHFGIPVDNVFFEFLINSLVEHEDLYQLHQLLQYHIISDSIYISRLLLSIEDVYPPALQLALDMLYRIAAYQEVVDVLLSHNMLLAALRVVQNHRLTVSPRPFVQAAAETHNRLLFYNVFRFFETMNEDSRGSSKFLPEDQCDDLVETFNQLFGKH